MKLSRALAVAAGQIETSPEQLCTIARAVAERRPPAVGTDCPVGPPPADTTTIPVDPVEHERMLGLSLQASHSLLTRTINLLK
jgi:hypothetical protein